MCCLFNGEPEAVAAVCCVNELVRCFCLRLRLSVYSTGLSAAARCMSLVYSWLYFGDAGQQHKNTSKTGDCACMAAGVCSAFLPLAGLGSTTVQQFCAQGCVWLQGLGQWVDAGVGTLLVLADQYLVR
jgi:hypothetical protein